MSLHKSRNIQPSKILLYKHLLSKISQNLKTKQSGFTLIELLVSMVILTVVVGMTGTGLVFVMSKNTSSDGEITQQANLRRALDFIGDEIKSASVVSTTSPGWTLTPALTSPAPTNILYLEIPTPVDTVALATLTVPNHGLVQGNAVKISGKTMPSGGIWPTGLITTTNSKGAVVVDTTVPYYISTTSTDTLRLITGSGTTITFSTTVFPQDFAIRRLVFYYPAANPTGWKGEQVLYRATGNCATNSTTADPSNCLVMVDSLVAQPTTPSASTAPFFPSIVAGLPPTISLNGKLCNPPTLENSCATTENNKVSVSLTAIPRATLQ